MQKLFFSYYRPNQSEIQRHKLRKDCIYLLERMGLPYEHVQGNFGGHLEDSILVKKCTGADITVLKKACRDYLRQDSVLVISSYGGARLHYLNGLESGERIRILGSDYTDLNYTYLGELKTVANDNCKPSCMDYSYSPLKNQFYIVE